MPEKVKSIIRSLPCYPMLYRKFIVPFRFKNEVDLIKGRSEPYDNGHPSVLFFTTHKCASVFTKRVVFRLADKKKLIPIDLEAYCWATQDPKLKIISRDERGSSTFKSHSYLYAPFRRIYPEIPVQDPYRIILNLRDPRDVLTSHYFSAAFGHPIPLANRKLARAIQNNRRVALDRGIDEHVRQLSKLYLPRYRDYCEQLLGRTNAFFVTYEEMIRTPSSWLAKITEFLEMDLSAKEGASIM